MHKKLYLPILCLVLASSYSLKANETLDLPTAIKQLSDADYEKREQASFYILKHATLEDLEKFSNDDDPEVRYRINTVIQNLNSGITPDTPPKVVFLVHEFGEAAPYRKEQIMVELKQMNAYVQIFSLNKQLDDEPVHRRIKKTVAAMSFSAVKYYLDEEQPDQALKVLDFAEPTTENCRLWAFIHRIQGQGKETLNTLTQKENPTPLTKERILALYRSEGDEKKAREWAESTGKKPFLTGQAFLKGDLKTVMEWWEEEFETTLPDEDYRKALFLRAGGDIEVLADYKTRFAQNAKGGELERIQSILQLTAMGELKQAFTLMNPDEKKNQTSYLLGRANYKTLFSLFGHEYGKTLSDKMLDKLNKDTPDGWWFDSANLNTKTLIAALIGLEDVDSLNKLITTQWEQTKKAEDEIQQKIQEKKQYETLWQLTRLGCKASVVTIIKSMNPEELATFVKSLKGTNELAKYYYEIAEVTFPEMTIPDRIDLVLALSTGQLKSLNNFDDITSFVTAVEQDCLAHPEDQEREERLAYLYETIGYKEKVFQYVQAKHRVNPSPKNAGHLLMQHLFFDQWEEAAKHALTYENTGLKYSTKLDIHKCAVLKKGGLVEEEQALLAELESSSFDTPVRYFELSSLYKEAGLYDDAYAYLQRGLLLTDPDENNFFHWNRFLELGQILYTKKGNHEMAALCGEMLIIKRLSNLSSSSMLTDSFASGDSFDKLSDLRYKTDLSWIRHFAKTGKKQSARQLATKLAEQWRGHGVLADDFYPLLIKLGYQDILAKSLNEGFDVYLELLKDYPNAQNQKNGAAWLASRAVMRLPEAEKLMTEALADEPRNYAFLDTMAEVRFAQGDRQKALELSLRAWQDSLLPGEDPLIKAQYYHFKNDPLPAKN